MQIIYQSLCFYITSKNKIKLGGKASLNGEHIDCKEKAEIIQFYLASEKVQVQILVLFLKQFYFFSFLVPYLKKLYIENIKFSSLEKNQQQI